MSQYQLTPAERAKSMQVNRLLTEVTEAHYHTCECVLCESRWRTDSQDRPEAWTVNGVTLASDEPD